MKCISCSETGELYLIESESMTYWACMLCLVKAKNNLKRIKKRTLDENELYKRLQEVTKGVLSA